MELLSIVGPFQIFILLILLAGVLILPIIALADILKNEFKGSDKIIWVLVVIFFPVFGSILYFTIGSSQKIGKQ